MFDEAELIELPALIGQEVISSPELREPFVRAENADAPSTSGDGPGKNTSLSEGTAISTATASTATTAAGAALPAAQTRHVVEACAMGGDNVALAMSDGELCHMKLSRLTEPVLAEEDEVQCPNWSAWRSKHGSVLHLQYDPAHDALVTLEVMMRYDMIRVLIDD